MKRWLVWVGLGMALAASNPTFVLNGKPTKLDFIEKGGKHYVEVQSFAKALGASVSYDKAKNQYVIVGAGQTNQTDVAGTAQMAGGEGVLGKTYTLGKQSPLNFTLKSAEYSVARVSMGNDIYAPKADEKLLILRFTVQNPQKNEQNLSYSSFKFTAVDAKDVNHTFDSYFAREGTNDILSIALKPAQKIEVYAVWPVAAAGAIPKLIVERESGAPVLRYDLRDKVKPLAAPIADPADSSGVSALNEVPVTAGTYYPLKYYDLKLESVAFSNDKMDNRPPAEGKRYLVATFSLKNSLGANTQPRSYSYSNFKFVLKDSDGEKNNFDGYLLKASRDEHANGELKSGEEYRFRVFFEVPQNTTGQTLYASEEDSRTYAFDIGSFK